MQDFSANSQRRRNCPFRPDITRPELGTLPWPSTCVLRRTTRRNSVTASWLTLTASWQTLPSQQYSTDSRGSFSVGGHVPARILGQAAVKIAAIRFNNWFCASLVLICACHSSAAMPCQPEEASSLPPHYEQKGFSVLMAIGCPSAPVKIKEVW